MNGKKVPQWLTYGLLAAGGIAAAVGYYENRKMQDYRDEYTTSFLLHGRRRMLSGTRGRTQTSRNVWYGIGAGLFAVGATFISFSESSRE